MSDTKSTTVNLSGLCTTLLTITFVILKALGYIQWSWLWVFAPLWIPLVLIAGIMLIWLVAVVVIGSLT